MTDSLDSLTRMRSALEKIRDGFRQEHSSQWCKEVAEAALKESEE